MGTYNKSKSVVIAAITKTLTVGAIHELPLPPIKSDCYMTNLLIKIININH